jgi:hypothetical protein
MKQTAVEWLVQRLAENGIIHSFDIEQAKAMEKEQIMNAWDMGISVQDTNDICSEYYYKETFIT